MRILKSVISCIVVSTLFVSVVPAAASTWSWSTSATLSLTGGNASNTQVTVSPNGLATAVWERYDGTNDRIQSSTSQSGGAWSTPANLSLTAGDASNAQVTVSPTGLATAVWERYDGTHYRIQSSTSQSGGAWSTPVNLSFEGGHALEPQVTVDSTGLATAVWSRNDGTHYRIQSSTSQSGGAWSTPANLSLTGGNASSPKVMLDSSGLVTAVWIRNSILQASNLPSGESWSTPVDVSVAGRTASTPSLTVDSTGRAIAVWKDTASGNSRVQSSTSLQGAAWSTPSNVSTSNPVYPEVTVDSNGLATAAWSHNDGDKHIIQSSTSLNGAAWSTPVNLSVTEDARDVELGVSADGLVTAVFELDFGTRIQATTSLNGASWSTPVNLSDEGGSAQGPKVTVDATGVAIAIWSRNNGTHSVVQSSTFSAPLPPPPPPSNEGSSEIVVAKPLVKAQATKNPRVFGSPTVSGVLRVSKQAWTGNPAPKLSYRWYACSKKIAAAGKKVPKSCKVIKGAKSRKLKLTANQRGMFVSVMVIGTSEGTSSTKLMSRSTARVS